MGSSPAVVSALLEAGADPTIKNDSGQTPLDLAHANIEVRKLLETAMETKKFLRTVSFQMQGEAR